MLFWISWIPHPRSDTPQKLQKDSKATRGQNREQKEIRTNYVRLFFKAQKKCSFLTSVRPVPGKGNWQLTHARVVRFAESQFYFYSFDSSYLYLCFFKAFCTVFLFIYVISLVYFFTDIFCLQSHSIIFSRKCFGESEDARVRCELPVSYPLALSCSLINGLITKRRVLEYQ